MRDYFIIYVAPGSAARLVEIVTAADYTKAYLKFIFAHPRGYMITEIREA